MNIAIWLISGAIAAWLALTFLQFNTKRSLAVTLTIGALGALAGGLMLAPAFSTTSEAVTGFNGNALGVALAAAATCLIISNVLSDRFDI